MEEKKLKRKKEKATTERNYDLLYQSCKELADEYLLNDKNELALSEYKEAAKAARKLDNKFYIAVTNRMIGETYCVLGEYEKAILYQKFHLKYAKDENNLIEKQRALATLGRTYFCQAESFSNSERTERAKSSSLSHKYYTKSLHVCEKLSSSNQLGPTALAEMKCRIFYNLGLTSITEGNYVTATEYISKAIAISKNMELWEDLYRCYSAEGSIHHRQGSTANALAAYEKGLQVAERCEKKTQFIPELLSNKADVLIMLCDYNGAKNVLIKAYKMKSPDRKDREEIEKKLRTVALIWKKEQLLLDLPQSDNASRKEVNEKLGDLCVHLKNYDRAIQHYHTTLECAQSMGLEEKGLGPIYFSLAQTYKDNKQYERSVEYSLKEFELIKDNHLEACQTLLNMCDTLELMSEPFDTLMRNYKNCLSLAKRSNDLKVEANVLRNILRIQEAHGREDLAEETKQELNVITCCLPDSQDEETGTTQTSDVEINDEEIDLEALIDMCSDDDDEDPLNQDKRVRRRPVRPSLTRRNEKGETPLHVASAKGNVQLIRSLVKQGHPVNIPDAAGWSPLHEACNHGQIDAVKVLIELGAKIDDRGGSSCDGYTPLLDAASNGHLELIMLLLDEGASPLAKTNKGDSVLDCLLACRDRAVAQGDEPDQDTQAYFDEVVERLKECYDKVGQSYSSQSNKSTPSRTQRSQGHSISKFRTQRRRTEESQSKAIDVSRRQSECEVNRSSDSVNSAKEYKEAIEALRRRNKKDTTYNEPLEKVKKNALLAEEDVGDDWLEDDMQGMIQPAKRRRENFVGQQLRQPSSVAKKPTNPPKPPKPPSPMLWDDDSEDVDDLFNSVIIPETPSSSRRSSSPEIEFTSFSTSSPTEEMRTASKPRQQSLESMNFQHFRPATSSTQTSEERSYSTPRPQQRQASLLALNFQRSRAPSSSPRPSEEPSWSLQSHPQPEPSQIATSAPFPNVRAIKVRIGNKLFLVPIPQSGDSLTIGWLANEASKRYENSEGVMPVLKLTTVDGALLDSNDPLSIILNDNEVHGRATSWKSKPPSERYKEACSVANVGVDSYLEQKLEMCQTSGSLDIRDRRLPVDTLSPLFKAIQHCERLRDICLSSVFLSDENFKAFVDHILTLTLVRSLDVSVNHITNDGLSHLAEAVSSGNFQSLQVLNISYNPLGEGCSRSLCTLSQQLPSLRTLNIRCVGLTSNFLHGNWFFEFNCLENLDIGFNKLDRESISKFLASLDADKIRSMNVSHAGSCEVLREVNLFLSRGSLENLEELSLAGLDVSDQDVRDLSESLLRAPRLSKLNLASNPKITVKSHEHLSQLKTLRELYLSGCALLSGSHELSLTLNKLTLSSETPISGFQEGLFNYFACTNRL